MKFFNRKTKTHQFTSRRRLSDDVTVRTSSEETLKSSGGYSYRRNRTLTGSLASHVQSANEDTSELRSPRVQSHDLKKYRKKLSILLISVSATALFLAFMIYQFIATVQVESRSAVGTRVNAENYSKLIAQYLAGHPLERFRFSLNTKSLLTYLQENGAPEVKAVDKRIKFSGLGENSMILEYRQPVVSWSFGNERVYVDGEGAAFKQNHFEEPTVIVDDQTGIATKNNQVVASGRFLSFMGKIIGRMADQNLSVVSMRLPAGTTRQVEVFMDGVGYPVKFSTDRRAGEQAEDAARAIRYLQESKISAKYIDVRVSGRAYYQ